MSRRRKLKPISQLIRKLEIVFNQYIRQRDTDWRGQGSCISCNKTFPYAKLDAGHYWSVKNSPIRFNEVNTNAQCQGCNRFREGNKPAYTLSLVRKYGYEVLNELDTARHEVAHWDRAWLEQKIKYYHEKVKTLR